MLPSAIKSSGQVTVCEDPTEPPWGYYSPPASHHWAGAEYALGQALGAKLGVRFAVQEQLFAGLFPAMLAGKCQVGTENLGDRKDRERSLNFVDYLLDGDGLLVAKGNPHHIVSLKDLCGLPIAITAGSTFLTYVQTQNKPICGSKPYSILTFPDDADTFLAVKSTKAVATLTDVAEAAYVAQTHGGGSLYQAVHDPKAPQGYAVAWIGMAAAKTYPQLAQAMLRAEQALVKSGAERTILSHYGLGFFAGTQPKLNACVASGPGC
jgi:polar amino acid transport system substrate-binding protein